VLFLLLARSAFAQPDSTRPPTLASLRGVVTDSTGLPLANATVTIDALRLTARAGDQGEYRLTAIPLGTHLVTVRALGYEPATLTIDFPAVAERTRTFALRLTRTTLDSVEVKAVRIDPRMTEFEEHRKLGLGHFITSQQLRKQEGQRLSSIVAMVPGLGLVNGRANQAWVLSKRKTGSLSGGRCRPWDASPSGLPPRGGSMYTPSQAEMSQGITCACYAQVYLDGQLMNPGMPADPFDVNSLPTHQIEAIEYYSGPSQTPSKYSRLNSPCGVYVMHTRRPDGG
jgi:Carboxypeptidase regulatory-like domain/TonB-dependent Receptor Plug Domain